MDEPQSPDASRTGIYRLSAGERLELAIALARRTDREQRARDALRHCYPTAPEPMLHSAAFHLYTDGWEAAVDFLADLELFLRDPEHTLDYGVSWHLLHHVYNWHQFRALLPEGRSGLVELVAELKQFVADGDQEAIRRTVEELEEMVEANRSAPDFDTP